MLYCPSYTPGVGHPRGKGAARTVLATSRERASRAQVPLGYCPSYTPGVGHPRGKGIAHTVLATPREWASRAQVLLGYCPSYSLERTISRHQTRAERRRGALIASISVPSPAANHGRAPTILATPREGHLTR